MSLILPRRRRYKLAAIEQQEILLPFVRYTPERDYPHYWQMPETSEDFDAMCAYGRECAAHLLQWLKDNRAACWAGWRATLALTTVSSAATG
ncbi:hypothetical protein [Chromobacterium haemolyticum]|uniref:hypothetical protein n=1 Tax=Chromobacterium haemolyticum TaxID=394935 RepID=UPI001269D7FB|nr:hypothetical protein [Chromobacterium haemolyticum]